MLIVNAAEIDLVGSDADYKGLLAEVAASPQGSTLLQPAQEPALTRGAIGAPVAQR